MDPDIYRTRETRARTALAALVVAAGYHREASAFVQGALRAIVLDGLESQAQTESWLTRCNEAVAEIAGNQAAAELATALAQRDEFDPNDD